MKTHMARCIECDEDFEIPEGDRDEDWPFCSNTCEKEWLERLRHPETRRESAERGKG